MNEPGLDLRGKSLLIFDDGLRALGGHWYEYDRAAAELHRERGASVTLICHRDFADYEALEAAGIEVLPIVERSLWAGDVADGGNEWLATIAHARYFAGLLAAHLATRRYDLVFVPNALFYDALAWRLVRRARRSGRVGRLALLFRFSVPGVEPAPGRPLARKFALWRLIFRGFRRAVVQGRVALLTDSTRLAAEHRRIAGFSPTVVASPRTLPFVEPSLCQAREINFAMIGHATWARGIDRFEQAIERLLGSGEAGGMRFLVQRSVEVRDPQGRTIAPSDALVGSDRIEFLTETLSSPDYARLFERIGCLVLPYRREHYRAQISGVAVEAACAGIPLIVTADTWLADFLAEQGAGIAVADGDVAGLAAAIRAIADDYPAYRNRAVERSAIARERNSPERFLRALWGVGADGERQRKALR